MSMFLSHALVLFGMFCIYCIVNAAIKDRRETKIKEAKLKALGLIVEDQNNISYHIDKDITEILIEGVVYFREGFYELGGTQELIEKIRNIYDTPLSEEDLLHLRAVAGYIGDKYEWYKKPLRERIYILKNIQV